MWRIGASLAVAAIVLCGCSAGPGAARWSATGNMLAARSGHTATLLRDGRVLVAGGMGGRTGSNQPLTSAELYAPGSGTWARTGSMLAALSEATATLLADGRVLVLGAAGSSRPMTAAELYDPNTGAWSAAGSTMTPRRAFTATLLPDGTVLVAGGSDPSTGMPLASAERFDPKTGAWSATGSMVVARCGHTATRLGDGRVLVAGVLRGAVAAGTGDGGAAAVPVTPSGPGPSPSGVSSRSAVPSAPITPELATAELYDPVTGTWSAAGDTSSLLRVYAATRLADGRVFVVGSPFGAVEIFDPGTATWTAGGANLGWMSPTVIALRDGRVFVSAAFDAVVIFEPRTNVSQITANVHCAGSGYATTLLADGRVLLTGGVVFHDTGWFEPSSETLAAAHLFRP